MTTFAQAIDVQLATARRAQEQLSRFVDLLRAARDVVTELDADLADLAAAPAPPRLTAAPDIVTPDDLDHLTCVCGKVCANGTGLSAHRRHCDEHLEQAPDLEPDGARYECNDCDGPGPSTTFDTIRALSGHTRAQHGRKPTGSEKMPIEVLG